MKDIQSQPDYRNLPIDKVGIKNSSVLFWIVAINCFSAILMAPIVILNSRMKKNKNQKKNSTVSLKNFKIILPIGIFSALLTICQMTAINLTLVAYVISIKRTSVIFSIVFAYFIFKEKGIKECLTGAFLMIIGVFLITLI